MPRSLQYLNYDQSSTPLCIFFSYFLYCLFTAEYFVGKKALIFVWYNSLGDLVTKSRFLYIVLNVSEWEP